MSSYVSVYLPKPRVPNAGGGFLSRETGARIFYSASWIFQKKPDHADGRPQSKVRNSMCDLFFKKKGSEHSIKRPWSSNVSC